MKAFFFLMLAVCGRSAAQAQHQLQKLWESDTTLAIPESVLPHPQQDILYVSLIDGGPWEADGRGAIAQLNKKGKIINATWATGLHAPKGMALYQNKLYVADLSDVVVIDANTGAVVRRIAIDSAQGLNDVTVDDKGTLYVSDSKTGKVHQIQNGSTRLFADNLKGVNGLRAVGTDVYILTANNVYKAGADKTMTVLGVMELGGDGIEPIGNGDFVTSTWSGVVYYLSKNGQVETLLDTRAQKLNTADIGYDAATRTVYVPTFFAKSVVAYRLQ